MLVDFDPMIEAVEALIALGYTVMPDEDFERWRVDGGEWITLGDLLTLARRRGLMDGPGRLQ
ncbi:hypothetical protein GOFOIKOB_6567 [Methylobacterium tardum]|uniref:Uncharacterized protein n=1 Tax=Methylobacterium tardum TaxID=374432 RepID=A0AA37WXQ4_9HYPH|nr:hypothetical protein [Methylobacterium tardum]GJE53486.1 hypothetical protein GOFOIKOB_6567 [Methylobacterium tardum]GLS74623.1 hypothetical protein GCM10007890_66410 [Methylobacterium tardum]